MDKPVEFSVEKVDGLPNRIRKSTGVYERIIADITSKGEGTYRITVGNNKAQTIYQQMFKHLHGREDLKLHKIGDKVFIVLDNSAKNKLGKPIYEKTEVVYLDEAQYQKEIANKAEEASRMQRLATQ
jgi:5-carboxymethyl-2-hydroxymuconate isomerase